MCVWTRNSNAAGVVHFSSEEGAHFVILVILKVRDSEGFLGRVCVDCTWDSMNDIVMHGAIVATVQPVNIVRYFRVNWYWCTLATIEGTLVEQAVESDSASRTAGNL